MERATDLLKQEFATVSQLIAAHAAERPDDIAIVDEDSAIDWRSLDSLVDRIAARLQADGLAPGQAVAIVGVNSIPYAAAYLGALRAGGVAAPLTSSATAEAQGAMIADCGARHLFADSTVALETPAGVTRIAIDAMAEGEPLADWIAPEGGRPAPATVAPGDAFNIIYSSGTTGAPKGIVQSHAMRWSHIQRGLPLGYAPDAVTINSTPLYSNTTLVSFLPTLAAGGKIVLMRKFDARRFLEFSQRERVTHAMLVPVQYRRLMAQPDFDSFDLSAYRVKTCTSAPFSAELKADVLKRWPGALIEIYGMTEGGAATLLLAHQYPDKLHTVGQPAPGNEIRLIDEEGREVAQGGVGEVVGRGPAMMTGYHNRAEASAAAEWFDAEGRRYIRHGDIGRFDEDGFLILMDRAKDMIISGGFNIYPSDLEAVLRAEPGITDAAVVGVPHPDWGETPVGFVVGDETLDLAALLASVNARLGKTQRLSALHAIDELPRSAIGKVLKRELRDRLA